MTHGEWKRGSEEIILLMLRISKWSSYWSLKIIYHINNTQHYDIDTMGNYNQEEFKSINQNILENMKNRAAILHTNAAVNRGGL